MVKPAVSAPEAAARRIVDGVMRERRPADREIEEAVRGLDDPEARRFVAQATFAAFRWWGWTRPLFEREFRRGLVISHLLDSGERIGLARDESATPPPRAAGIAARAAWLRANARGAKLDTTAARLVPRWLFELAQRPASKTFERDLLESLQRPAPLWIRRVGDRAIDGLRLAPHERVTGAARVTSSASVYDTAAFRAGAFEVQDLASQAVGLACAPRGRERWWDACAGAGGKTLHLAALLRGKGTVVATDVKPRKLDEARRRVRRADGQNVEIRAWDGERPPGGSPTFDGALVDAPCTGIGTWRRNPDGRWRTTPDDVRELSAMQRRILARVADGVRPGGRLIYAVCTITRAETEDVVAAFLAERRDFALAPAPHPLTGEPTDGRIWIWPWVDDTDAMFIATFLRS
jgi:16S rRNA (cytosine967-C5)-methyltransferase